MTLFQTFLDSYLGRSGDEELCAVLPPFLAFRALVIAHPRWYPALDETTRRALLDLARAMAAAETFDASTAFALLGQQESGVMPEYPVAVIPHPVGSLSPDEVTARADAIAGRIAELLLGDSASPQRGPNPPLSDA